METTKPEYVRPQLVKMDCLSEVTAQAASSAAAPPAEA